MNKMVVLENGNGEMLTIELTPEGDTFLGSVRVDGVPYHVERVSAERLRTRYCQSLRSSPSRLRRASLYLRWCVDSDPDYFPKHDSHGECVLFAPYIQ